MIPKFRAFIKETKQIVDVDWIFFKSEVAKVTDNEFYQFEDIILMQSTGLHDKNGVEVFEGDVLKSKDGTDGLISRFIVEKDDFYTGFIPMNREGYGFNRTMCEVIGNIYENPELLEDVWN